MIYFLYAYSPEVASCEYFIPQPSKPEHHLRIELVAGASAVMTPTDVLKKALIYITVSICEDVKNAETVEIDTQRPPSPLGMVATQADLPPEVPLDNILSESNLILV